MIIHELHGPPSPELGSALREFEAQFKSSLGRGLTYHMSHGGDVARQYCTLGDGACFVAEEKGKVVGFFGVAIVRLWLPDGSERKASYVGDVRLLPPYRRTTVLWRLIRPAMEWAMPQTDAFYSYVKDVTPIKPSSYTGRLGIPPFEKVGRATLFRIPLPRRGGEKSDARFNVPSDAGNESFHQLARGRFARPSDANDDRSEMEPTWFATPNGLACGRLEDRLKINRILVSDGSERRPVYLSAFAFHSATAGAQILEAALRRAARLGYHALYVDIPEQDAAELQQFLQSLNATGTPAAIFASGLPVGPAWHINSSEI